jgi:sRNA-binding protein
MTEGAQVERRRGLREARTQIALLRAKWPTAFPKENGLFRPLASNVPREIAAACGWSLPYARGVLEAWKNQAAYCLAVITHSRRIGLDGAPSDEDVDEEAIDYAKRRLSELAAKASPPPKPRRMPPMKPRPRR